MKLVQTAVVAISSLGLTVGAFAGANDTGSTHNVDKRLEHAHEKDAQFDAKAGKGEGSKQEEHWDAKVVGLEALQAELEGTGAQ